jgi:hypothetical protein
MLPWPIIKKIADLTGEPWRVRVCRKLRSIIPFPEVYGNAVYYAPNLPFHPNKMIIVTSGYTFILNYIVPLMKSRFVIVWRYDQYCADIVLKHKDFLSSTSLPTSKFVVLHCEDFLEKIK